MTANSRLDEILTVLHDQMANTMTSWSIGSFGAIAEFKAVAGEAVRREITATGGTLETKRGGLRIDLPEGVSLHPYETLDRRATHWQHGINMGLDKNAGGMAARKQLTELGPDEAALRPEDRAACLFDFGLGLPHVEACVRTDDASLIAVLRINQGRSVLDPQNPAMIAIKAASPHRVFVSRLGRIEVYQHIGSTSKNIPTPEGPHTHVLPRLLTHNRTHAATVPFPDGLYPTLSLYPANPALDDTGAGRRFDADDHLSFQRIYQAFGDPALLALKSATEEAVRGGKRPALADHSRFERIAVRIMLRQMAMTDGESAALSAWREAYEPGSERVEDDAAFGH